MTLTDFLLARLAEDEAVSQLRHQRETASPRQHSAMEAAYGRTHYVTDPASLTRVLADCEAKRRIVEWYGGNGGADAAACWFLALPYSDHPDYREEWKP